MATTLLTKPTRLIPTAPDPPVPSQSAPDLPPDVQIGDWVVFADGTAHRVADRFNWREGVKRISTAANGTFYIGTSQRYFLGNQHQSIEFSTMTPTSGTRLGACWNYQSLPGKRVAPCYNFVAFRVWNCTLPCPKPCPGSR